MELTEAVRRRHMVRTYAPAPVPEHLLLRVLDGARRAPSAGHSQGTDLIVLTGQAETRRYWDVTLPDGPRRASFRWPGLVAAPVLVVVVVDPGAYVGRYAEPDKAGTGLGSGPDAWPVPYWFVDGGMAAEAILLGAVDAGLGACFFGLFGHEGAVLDALGVPAGRRAVGTISLGWPTSGDEPGRSVARPRRTVDDVVHRGGW